VLTGQATHWLQGASSADFGSGVHVDQLTVQSPTQATAVITVLSTATLGFHAVGMLTDGEFASMAQGLNVVQGTPVLLSSSPNAGQQATTFEQVLGQFTHWQQGLTTASYGNGVIVNAFTVIDAQSGCERDHRSARVRRPGPCHSLTVTTSTEQVGLASQLCVHRRGHRDGREPEQLAAGKNAHRGGDRAEHAFRPRPHDGGLRPWHQRAERHGDRPDDGVG
jgi:hypothetical protein